MSHNHPPHLYLAGPEVFLRDPEQFYAQKKKNSTIFWVEVCSDLTARTMDIWTTTPGYYAKNGGVVKREIVRYAVPYHLYAKIAPSTAEEANYTFVNGFICWANTAGSENVLAAQRQFARLRQELREAVKIASKRATVTSRFQIAKIMATMGGRMLNQLIVLSFYVRLACLSTLLCKGRKSTL